LKDNTFGGVSIRQVASLPYVLAETLFLLFSSFTYGLCFYFLTRHQKRLMMFWLSITFILGLCFVLMEFHEFSYLVHTGNSWQRSAFLSSFFSLVGIHGIHVLLGLIWMFVLMMQFSSKGLTPTMRTRFVCLGLFWHFLDIMWIFIFTLVYLMGAI